MKGRKKLYDLISKNGFWETKEMLNIPAYDLYRISKHPIDCDGAGYVLWELGNKRGLLSKKYKEFTVEFDYDGVLRWGTQIERDNIYVYVLATPFWDGICEVPVDVELEKETGSGVILLGSGNSGLEFFDSYGTPKEFKDIEELLIWFKEVYLPETYSTIHRLIDEGYVAIEKMMLDRGSF